MGSHGRLGDLNLDIFKQRTLGCLNTKQEEHTTYPIYDFDLMTVEECRLCGCEDLTPLTEVYLEAKLNFLSTSVCNNCRYTFRTIAPSIHWFDKCWKAISTGKLEVFNNEVEVIRKTRYQAYYDFLSEYVKPGHMLDIGAAYGTGTKVFQDGGFRVEALTRRKQGKLH